MKSQNVKSWFAIFAFVLVSVSLLSVVSAEEDLSTSTSGMEISDVTLDGGHSVIVESGDSVNTVVTVTTWGTGEGNDWESTEYMIEGQGWHCVNTEQDVFYAGVYSKSFTITIPTLAVNSYDFSVRAYRDSDHCEGFYDNYTLDDGIIVQECIVDADCDNGAYCDGAESCSNGVCVDGSDVVCTTGDVCYLPDGICNEETDKCDFSFIDNEGPVTSNLNVTKVFGACGINLEALITDDCSDVKDARYFIGSCGVDGTGFSLNPTDGSFDKFVEAVYVYNVFSGIGDGRVDIYVKGKDDAGNWGACKHVNIDIDCDVPGYPTCEKGDDFTGVAINGDCNADELLVCGDDPLLEANICDVQSTIQLAEYFIDEDCEGDGCLNWDGFYMNASDGTYLDEHCEDVEALINLSELSEGTHYVEVHGKDSQENWGKFDESAPDVSFIKDTTAPKTLKELKPFDEVKVECSNDTANGEDLTDGCYYVKQGTVIELSARDFNPDESDVNQLAPNDEEYNGYNNLEGEYAGDITIHYEVWWSFDGTSWELDQSGDVNAEEVSITLSEDSYHLIKYWSTDGVCGNAEDPHFELDIVDTRAPNTTFGIVGPYYNDTEEGKIYVDSATRINLTCVDGGPHPVNDVEVWYSYRVDEGDGFGAWIDGEYNGQPFGFPEESMHELVYWCVDALGNTEDNHSVTLYVDKTKPETNISYGQPLVEREDWFGWTKRWITSDTEIDLSATDDFGANHDSGLNFTKYRITQVDEDACRSEYSGCLTFEGKGDWNVSYEEDVSFNINETSCHLIEYYSVDMVNKTEDMNKACVFVDNEAPETFKAIDADKFVHFVGWVDNKILMNDSCDPQNEICDYWITQDADISLSCFDVLPHPVDNVTLFWRWGVDNGTEYEWNAETDGQVVFSSEEDCLHKLEWYCSDELGNSEGSREFPIVERDNVDTQGPNVTAKFARVMKDGEEEYGDVIAGEEGEETIVAITSDDTVKLCANITDYKQTGDLGVGVKKAFYRFVGLDDPMLTWDDEEQAYCIEKDGDDIRQNYCHNDGDCGAWRFEVAAVDELWNWGKWTNGLTVIVDNVAPVGEVLNPHAGNYYRDGVPFQVYAPAVDFGGDYCSLCEGGYNEDCPASGVDYCELYAIDYDFEGMNQSEIKECYSDLLTYFEQVGANPNIVPLGKVPYENGVCKGAASLPENSGLTDTVFLGINYVDKAGNEGNDLFGYHLQLALNPWFSPITMNIDNDGPMVYINDSNLPGPVTSGQNVNVDVEVADAASGFDDCWADIYTSVEGEADEDTGLKIEGYAVDFDSCEISGALPNDLESGDYMLKVNARDEKFNVGTVETLMRVDNTRPTMSVVAPLEGEVYGEMFPVSLNVQDGQSNIASETVKFRISEIPALGNVYCVFGSCESTNWVMLTEQSNGLYAGTFNLSDYDISGEGRYVFDAVACDDLYVAEDDTELGFSLNNDRTDSHCRMISEHGQVEEEVRPACDDGIDNDGDGQVDFLGDGGCYSSADDDENSVCGNGELEIEEECDDGNTDNGDGCSSVCAAEEL